MLKFTDNKKFIRFVSRKVERYWMNSNLIITVCVVIMLLLMYHQLTDNIHTRQTKCSMEERADELPILSNILDYKSRNKILEQFGWTATRPQKRVIIVTYMRSGSSFTGSIIGAHPDVIYFFEPLHSMHKYKANSRRSRPSMFILDNARDISDMGSSEELTQQILESYLNCDFLKLDLKTLQDRFPFLYHQTTPFTACSRSNPGLMGVVQCLATLYKQCTQSSATAIKTIRTSMYTIRQLLKIDTNLKVIYLLRDPRATTLSQLYLKRADPPLKLYNRTSQKLCNTMWLDIVMATKLMKQHPDRIIGLMYEDLIRDPYKIARRMFEFIGLEYDDDVTDHIKAITNGKRDGKCVTCVSRKNSTKTALRWRQEINYKGVLAVDENCQKVYRMTGYLPVSGSDVLRDRTIDLRVPPRLPVLA
ncbi:carbohydrate sulfotransferase 4 [Patella vulgata]|uniref:carbohydrate sulfotransferase 4 n=1 Tax=Patella vulgata TaxID=6465 RepID=UPI0024A98FB7|nr:carbohydrate sulfotransferase 4 [Patella vulgata]